jgi:hypothetical protein
MNDMHSNKRIENVLIGTALSIVALSAFIPHGMTQAPAFEGWIQAAKSMRPLAEVIKVDSRFIQPFFWHLLYWIQPNSFVLVNVVMAACFVLRPLLIFAIIRRLVPEQRFLAFAAAVLFTYHPSDMGYFWFITVFILFDLVAALTAFYLLLAYWQDGSAWRLVLMIPAQLVAVWLYEGYTLVLLAAPLLLLCTQGGEDRLPLLPTLSLWYTIPLAWFLFWLMFQNTGRARSVFDPQIGRALESLWLAFSSVVWSGWYRSIANLGREPAASFMTISVFAGIFSAIVGFWLAREQSVRIPYKQWFFWFGIVVGLIFLAQAPFAISEVAMHCSRTRFLSAAGGAFILAGLLLFFLSHAGYLRRGIVAVFLGFLVTASINHAILVRGWKVEAAQKEASLFMKIIDVAPLIEPNTTIAIVLDSTIEVDHFIFDRHPIIFWSAFRFLYVDNSLMAVMLPSTVQPEKRMIIDDDRVVIHVPWGQERGISNTIRNLLVIHVPKEGPAKILDELPPKLANGNLTPGEYQPHRLVTSGQPNIRACKVFSAEFTSKCCRNLCPNVE